MAVNMSLQKVTFLVILQEISFLQHCIVKACLPLLNVGPNNLCAVCVCVPTQRPLLLLLQVLKQQHRQQQNKKLI